MASSDLHQRLERLRRLGLHRGTEHLRPAAKPLRLPPAPDPAPPRPDADPLGVYPIEALLPGQSVETELGACFVVQETYPRETARGGRPLADCLALTGDTVARLDNDPLLAAFDFRHAAFIDTETSGLDAATGTYAFLIGVGTFAEDSFTLTQYFLRDPSEEAAALHLLTAQLASYPALVTFNGRHFDVPLLMTRYIMNRQHPPFAGTPHLDLLLPARRIWRARLPSRALGDLERDILHHRRTQADVPGWLIPQLYVDYVRTGDARELARVFYHNAEDILSMATLAATLCDAFGGPPEQLEASEAAMRARWHEARAELAEAEAACRAALAGSLSAEVRRQTLAQLGRMLKRQGRRAEAVALWREWVEADAGDDLTPCVELAKQHEWHDVDLHTARDWTRVAIAIAESWPRTPQRTAALAELQHRLARLERKLAGRDDGSGAPET